MDLQNRRTQLPAKFLPGDRLVQEAEKEIADTRAALDRATQATASEQSTHVNWPASKPAVWRSHARPGSTGTG